MRIALFLALAALSQTVYAEGYQNGQIVRTSTGAKVGMIDRVNADGSVRIIYGERFVTLPADSLKSEKGAVWTSMDRKGIDKLRN